MENTHKLVLYQKYPGQTRRYYDVEDHSKDTVIVNTFSPDDHGLTKAIKAADRKDAIIMFLPTYYESQDLMDAIEDRLKSKSYHYLFQPRTSVKEFVNESI